MSTISEVVYSRQNVYEERQQNNITRKTKDLSLKSPRKVISAGIIIEPSVLVVAFRET